MSTPTTSRPRVPEALSAEREAAEYRALSAAERAELLAAACRAGARLLASRPDAERAAAHEDPLPESSLRALERLRAEYRARGGRRPTPSAGR